MRLFSGWRFFSVEGLDMNDDLVGDKREENAGAKAGRNVAKEVRGRKDAGEHDEEAHRDGCKE